MKDIYYKKLFSELSIDTINSIRDDIKENNKLLYAKLGLISIYDAEHLCVSSFTRKIRSANEAETIRIANVVVHEGELKTIDDIVNKVEDVSDTMDVFLSYCEYYGYTSDHVYRENVSNGNYDGIFSLVEKYEKAKIMGIDDSMVSIYTDRYLIDMWNKLTDDEKVSMISTYSEANW